MEDSYVWKIFILSLFDIVLKQDFDLMISPPLHAKSHHHWNVPVTNTEVEFQLLCRLKESKRSSFIIMVIYRYPLCPSKARGGMSAVRQIRRGLEYKTLKSKTGIEDNKNIWKTNFQKGGAYNKIKALWRGRLLYKKSKVFNSVQFFHSLRFIQQIKKCTNRKIYFLIK